MSTVFLQEYHIDGFRFDLASILTRAHSAWHPADWVSAMKNVKPGEEVCVDPKCNTSLYSIWLDRLLCISEATNSWHCLNVQLKTLLKLTSIVLCPRKACTRTFSVSSCINGDNVMLSGRA